MEEEGSKAIVLWSLNHMNNSNPFMKKEREFHFLGKTVKIMQRPSGADGNTLGSVCWDSAHILCSYLEKTYSADHFVEKQVLELGAGTGLVGIVAALLDMEQLELIQQNIDINLTDGAHERTTVAELTWGDSNAKEFASRHPRFDYIVCSDVVYNPYGFEPLLQTLMELSQDATATTPQTEVIMAYKQRYPIEQKFFRAAAKLFRIREIAPSQLPPEYQASGVYIYHFTKMQQQTTQE